MLGGEFIYGPTLAECQRAWDDAICSFRIKSILGNSLPSDRARLLASCVPGVGSWLHALPNATLGLRLSDSETRITVGLCLAYPIVTAHAWIVGARVQPNGHYGLACKRSAGGHSRHYMINKFIARSLRSEGIPAILELPELFRCDSKRPDGATLIPWSCSRSLV